MSYTAFGYTGGMQTFTVPAGVTSVRCDLYGAGSGFATAPIFEEGGYVTGALAVSPGQVLNIFVGGAGKKPSSFAFGAGGYNGGGPGSSSTANSFGGGGGGGGGGATDVRVGGTALANRVAVAPGAGGSTGTVVGFTVNVGLGGSGGGLTGADGTGPLANSPGKGATSGAGGAAGTAGDGAPTAGALGQGGTGGNGVSSTAAIWGGGGGGGGLYGGGGGRGNHGTAANEGGAGGGGSAYLGGLTFAATIAGTTPSGRSDGAPGWDFVNGYAIISYDLPPNAPTLNAPTSGAYIAQDLANTFAWTHSDPEGDLQSSADMQWRVGAGAWTLISAMSSSNTQSHVFAATFWAAQVGSTVEWQMRTYDASGVVGPWSTSSFFNVATTPTAPTITTPTAGATIVAPTQTVNWTSTNQGAYEITRVRDNAGTADPTTVYFDSGVTVSTALTTSLAFPVNNRFEHIQFRYRDATSGLWSTTLDVRVDVVYVLPMVPTLVVTPHPTTANVTLAITNPTPTGGAPVTDHNDIWAIFPDGTTVMIASGLTLNKTVTYEMPIAGTIFYVIATAANTVAAQSANSTALVLPLMGVWLLNPLSPTTTKGQWLYNDVGAAEAFDLEAVYTQYAGRQFPAVDFGTAESNVLTIKITTFDTDGMQAKLHALILSQAILCYRDKKGRRLFGTIVSHPIQDANGVAIQTVVFTRNDFTELPTAA